MSTYDVGAELSAREWQIALLAAQGLTDKEIQRRLGLSSSTVSTYWKRIREKLHTVNRAQAIARLAARHSGHHEGQARHSPVGPHTISTAHIAVTVAPGPWLALSGHAEDARAHPGTEFGNAIAPRDEHTEARRFAAPANEPLGGWRGRVHAEPRPRENHR